MGSGEVSEVLQFHRAPCRQPGASPHVSFTVNGGCGGWRELLSYPPVVMLQFGEKLELDTQSLISVQLQDGNLRTLKV